MRVRPRIRFPTVILSSIMVVGCVGASPSPTSTQPAPTPANASPTTQIIQPPTTQGTPAGLPTDADLVPDPLANVGSDVRLLAADDEGLWVIHGSGLIEQRDSDNLQRRYQYQVGPDTQVLAAQAGNGSLFLSDFASQTVIRLDTGRLEPAFVASVTPLQQGMTLVDDTVWVACCGPDQPAGEGTITGVDVETGHRMDVIGAPNPQDLVWGHGKLWVADISPGGVTALDTHDPSVQRRVDIDDVISHIAIAADSVWAGGQQALYEIDPETMQIVRAVPFPACGNCTKTYDMAGNGNQIAVTIPHHPVVAIGDGTNWTAYGIDRPVALAMTQSDVWVADADGSIYRIGLSGNAGGEPHQQALCNTSQLLSDFDGDGQEDIASIAARPSPGPCRARPGLEDWTLTVTWAHGTTSTWPLPRCGTTQPNGQVTATGICEAFAAPDLNGDGRAELAVKTQQAAGSISILQFYELSPDNTAPRPLEVAPGGPGPEQITPGQAMSIGYGAAPYHVENLECTRGPDGHPLIVLTSAESGEDEWSVFEGTWRFDGKLFHYLSDRKYHVTKDSPEANALVPDGRICGAPIGQDATP